MAKDGRLALPFACALAGTILVALALPAARAAEQDDDTFREEHNKRRTSQEVVAQDEKEYAAQHFDAALKGYEDAYRADPTALADFQERWAYCQLSRVFLQLKDPPPGAPAYAE